MKKFVVVFAVFLCLAGSALGITIVGSGGCAPVSIEINGTTGPTGPTGATGPAGPAGTNGTDGSDGSDGAPGAPGVNGINGTNGVNGTTTTLHWLNITGKPTTWDFSNITNVNLGMIAASNISGTLGDVQLSGNITKNTAQNVFIGLWNYFNNINASIINSSFLYGINANFTTITTNVFTFTGDRAASLDNKIALDCSNITMNGRNVCQTITEANLSRTEFINYTNTCSGLDFAMLTPLTVTPTVYGNTTARCTTFSSEKNVRVTNMSIMAVGNDTLASANFGVYNMSNGQIIFNSTRFNLATGMNTFSNSTPFTLIAGQQYAFCLANQGLSAVAIYSTTGSIGTPQLPMFFNMSAPTGRLPPTITAPTKTGGGFPCAILGTY